MSRDAVPVYAIVRVDLSTPVTNEGQQSTAGSVSFDFQVKEVVPSLAEAEREVARLNALNTEKGATYLWQYTRYFPDGRAVEPS